jgi:uncharacterized repeat protein (TIGR03943 family)
VNREAQSVVALLVGGAVLRISLTDVYLRYVKEGLRPFLIAAGVLLVAVAMITIWREFRRPARAKAEAAKAKAAAAAGSTPEPVAEAAAVTATEGATVAGTVAVVHAEDVDDDGHGHSHGGPWVAWLLILPVLAIFLVAPPALGSYSANREGANTVQQKSDFPPLPKNDPVALPMVEYVGRAVWEDGKSMQDRNIRLTGFLTPRKQGGAYLTRIVLSCCAADGRPVKVRLDGDVPTAAEPDTWLEVTGTYAKGTEKDKLSGAEVPTLKVGKVSEIPAPRNPYES